MFTLLFPQIIPTKLIKSEPMTPKDAKLPPPTPHEPHQLHPKDMTSPIGAYPGIFPPRHGLNVPQAPPPHNLREEDLRRYVTYT